MAGRLTARRSHARGPRRAVRRHSMLIPLTLASVASALTGCGAGGQTMTGTYTIPLPEGVATLSLHVLPSGEASGWMRAANGAVYEASGFESVDDEGDISIEGTLTGSMNADFELYEEEAPEFGLLLLPHDPAGVPQMGAAMAFAATRSSDVALGPGEGIAGGREDLGGGRADGSSRNTERTGQAGDGDPRLVGIWSTQVVMNSEVGGIGTQLFMEFRADGIMRELGSRAIGSLPGGGIDTGFEGGGEQALWRTQGDVLWTGYAGTPAVPLARYEFSQGRLVLRYLQDGSTQIWSRAR